MEILGPATYSMWKSCWTILSNALLLLGAVDLGNLVDYGKFMDRFIARHGERSYPLMYQAEVRTRMELMGRLLREEQGKIKTAAQRNDGVVPADWPFDPDRPWNFIFQRVLDEGDTAMTSWWYQQLEYKALLHHSKAAQISDMVEGDAAIGGYAPPPPPPGVDSFQSQVLRQRAQPKPKAKPRASPLHILDATNSYYTHSRKGHPICPDFNSLGCDAAVRGHWCPRGNGLHVCNRCLRDHPVNECNRSNVSTPTFLGKGKGKGKGKEGKGKGKGGKRHGPYTQG